LQSMRCGWARPQPPSTGGVKPIQTDSNRVKVLSVTTGVMLTVDKNLRMTMSMRGIENWVKPSQKTFVY